MSVADTIVPVRASTTPAAPTPTPTSADSPSSRSSASAATVATTAAGPSLAGVGAAVANAIYNATGVRVRDYPVTLDKMLARMPALA